MNSYRANLHHQAGCTIGQHRAPHEPSFCYQPKGGVWILAAISAALLSLTTAVQAQPEYEAVITITGYTGPGGEVIIPDTIDGMRVIGIGDSAFRNNSSVTGVVIPDSVTTIGSGAFAVCDNLTSITIPDSVTEIGSGAFGSCTSLSSLTIPNSITSIGDMAFSRCRSLASIEIPDSVTYLGGGAFFECDNLAVSLIGNSVTSLNSYYNRQSWIGAFAGCSRLTSVTIGDSVTNIDVYAFSGCTSLRNIRIGVSVTSIGYYAFSGCTSLTSITLLHNVTSIVGGAFDRCTSLTKVYFEGTAPSLAPFMGRGDYFPESVIVYYLPGTTGWGPTFADRPTALWIPVVPNLPSATSDTPLRGYSPTHPRLQPSASNGA